MSISEKMRVRKLKKKDAEHMFEWMHDDSVVRDLLADFSKKSIDDCQRFIDESQNVQDNLHLAIVNDDDIYMGTVSLKHIDLFHKYAEFAIVVRKIAMGKGYSIYGMNEIFEKGTNDFDLKDIYWCVSGNNLRALGFYNKNGFERCMCIPTNIKKKYPKDIGDTLVWYCVHL